MKYIDKNNKETNSNCLNQGLEILSERKNNISLLKHKINHSDDNLIEGFFGRQNIEGFCDNEELNEKQSCLENEYKVKGEALQTNIAEYGVMYTTFLDNVQNAYKDISSCRNMCSVDDSYEIEETDRTSIGGDPSLPTKASYKTLAKRACMIGCHLQHSPEILDCSENGIGFETAKSMGTNNATGLNVQVGDDCNTIYENVADKSNITDDEKDQLKLILDENNYDAWNHCCSPGKLEDKFKPYKWSDGNKITDCNDTTGENGFKDTEDDRWEGTGVESRQVACNKGFDMQLNPQKVQSGYGFRDNYSDVIQKNESISSNAQNLLDLVKSLKDLGKEIVIERDVEVMNFINTNESYEEVLEDIKDESNPKIINTLNKYIEDKVLLKKSTDLRLYVWIVLALGFGISALMKIKSL